jgi:hypothetical protein
VQKVRERIHELNRATISLYRMARYLGYAQRVLSELTLGQLKIARSKRDEMIALLSDVRRELNGTSETDPGAGIVDDLQDLIGESVWNLNNSSVITYYEFRERLLNATGWALNTKGHGDFVVSSRPERLRSGANVRSCSNPAFLPTRLRLANSFPPWFPARPHLVEVGVPAA